MGYFLRVRLVSGLDSAFQPWFFSGFFFYFQVTRIKRRSSYFSKRNFNSLPQHKTQLPKRVNFFWVVLVHLNGVNTAGLVWVRVALPIQQIAHAQAFFDGDIFDMSWEFVWWLKGDPTLIL